MCKAIAQFQLMLGWMEDLAEAGVVPSQKHRAIRCGDLEHGNILLPGA